MTLIESYKERTNQVPYRTDIMRSRGGRYTIKELFKNRLGLFIACTLFVLMTSVLKKLSDDSTQIFYSQKSSLILSVFSRTDLEPMDYTLLKNKLISLNGVKEVLSTSPKESANILAKNKELGIDAEWMINNMKRSGDTDTILPWSYDLYLNRWDERSLTRLISQIQSIKLGSSQKPTVAKVYYDEERWSLAMGLYEYSRWLNSTLICIGAFLLVFIMQVVIKFIESSQELMNLLRNSWSVFLFGVFSAAASHVLFLFLLSVSFYPESFSLIQEIGTLFLFQLGLGIVTIFLLIWQTQTYHKI